MSTTGYPPAQALLDKDGKPRFPITHADYVINGVNRNNPRFFGSIFLNGTEVFQTDSKGNVQPLTPADGGTGYSNLTDLANEIARILGLTSGSGASQYTCIPISKGGTGATTAAAALTALGAASAALYSTNVPVNWTSESDGTYTQTLTVAGIKNTDVPVVGVTLSNDASAAVLQGKAFACVNRITTSTNSIKMICYNSKPSTAFTIQLLTVRGF